MHVDIDRPSCERLHHPLNTVKQDPEEVSKLVKCPSFTFFKLKAITIVIKNYVKRGVPLYSVCVEKCVC